MDFRFVENRSDFRLFLLAVLLFHWQPAGGKYGAWFNSSTGDSLHPDLNHPEPIGPHWDWVNRLKNIIERIFKKNGL